MRARTCIATALLSGAVAQAPSPTVQTANGPVQGLDFNAQGQAVSNFLGIPFAEPPVGALRFHYPQALEETWTAVRDVTTPPSPCTQGAHAGTTPTAGSEDCLYLNVFTPTKAIGTSSPLPTMFFIYGGGFLKGDSWEVLKGHSIYNGTNLAGRHDVIVVTSNYRLNALGFGTFVEGSNGETGTMGLADQRLAMQWTQDNVAAFGGDASQVTLFGESAGAMSVIYHLVSEPSWPLFHRAIIESGNAVTSWMWQPRDNAVALYQGWADGVGCPSGTQQLTCLQSRPAEALAFAPTNYTGLAPTYGTFSSAPVIDGTYHGLAGLPLDLIQAGKFHKVPIIMGANKDGGTVFEKLFLSTVPNASAAIKTEADVNQMLDWYFSQAQKQKILAAYPYSEFSTAPNKYTKMVDRALRDAMFQCQSGALASVWAANGLDAYVYSFSFDLGPLLEDENLGDFHGLELVFVFKNDLEDLKLLPFRGNVDGMSDIMSCQWASFAYAANPNGGSKTPPNCADVYSRVEAWPSFRTERAAYIFNDASVVAEDVPKTSGPMVLQKSNTYPHDLYPSDDRCDVWAQMTYPWHSPTALV